MLIPFYLSLIYSTSSPTVLPFFPLHRTAMQCQVHGGVLGFHSLSKSLSFVSKALTMSNYGTYDAVTIDLVEVTPLSLTLGLWRANTVLRQGVTQCFITT